MGRLIGAARQGAASVVRPGPVRGVRGPEVIVSNARVIGLGIHIDRLPEIGATSTLLVHAHRTAVGADERDGKVAHEAVLEVDEEVLEVLRRLDHLARVEGGVDDGRAEALRLVVRDEEAATEVHVGRAVVSNALGHTDHRVFLAGADLKILRRAFETRRRRDQDEMVDQVAIRTVVVVDQVELDVVGPGLIVAVGHFRARGVGVAIVEVPLPARDEEVLGCRGPGAVELDFLPDADLQRNGFDRAVNGGDHVGFGTLAGLLADDLGGPV